MKAVLSTIAILALGAAAQADTLWEQAPDASLGALVDQSFPDSPGFDSYLMADVSFGSDVTLDAVTTYFTNANQTWTGITSGLLSLTPKSSVLPDNSYDPGVSGMTVAVSVLDNGDGTVSITASGLGLALGAGDYWIGLTPMAEFGTFGQEFHLDSGSTVGAMSAFRNPGSGFGLGTDWSDTSILDPMYSDMAILIEGTKIPAPAALAVLGLAGMTTRRRRNA